MYGMYPNIDIDPKEYSLASLLFGHRMRANQTMPEYLIEFLQVLIAKKSAGLLPGGSEYTLEYFPHVDEKLDRPITYEPQTRIGLKRFIFFPHSKPEGKAKVDEDAYVECVRMMRTKIDAPEDRKKDQIVKVIQDLLYGFNAVNQSRSWFDQNMLPICEEVILPEGMGVKAERKNISFSIGKEDVDKNFSYTRYTYMCRGGEIYYLHLLDGVNRCGDGLRFSIESKFKKLIQDSYPQFSSLSGFIQRSWDQHMLKSPETSYNRTKEIVAIPSDFSVRSKMAAMEIDTLLSNNIHPFDKISILADAVVFQLLRVMHVTASIRTGQKDDAWVLDLCKVNPEMRKLATSAFARNEECIIQYIYEGYDHFENQLRDQKDKEQKNIKDAFDDSYKLYRKLGKSLGFIIPQKGPFMRLTLSERIVRFLVLSLLQPQQKVTLDVFLGLINEHFGMVIDRDMYEREAELGRVKPLGDLSFLDQNKESLSSLLKNCGFLRDISDATAIVENPYDPEVIR